MILIDSLLYKGLKFVFTQLSNAVEAEMNDDSSLYEQLLEAQMRLELGEIDEEEFASLEREILARLREIRQETHAALPITEDVKITGVEIELEGD